MEPDIMNWARSNEYDRIPELTIYDSGANVNREYFFLNKELFVKFVL